MTREDAIGTLIEAIKTLGHSCIDTNDLIAAQLVISAASALEQACDQLETAGTAQHPHPLPDGTISGATRKEANHVDSDAQTR